MARLLIFDSEFTDNTGELLELAIYDIAGSQAYHSYFKPRRAKTWALHPHNITPQMVADKPAFEHEIPALQQLFDSATHLVGFEVESDIEHLHEQGLKNLYYKAPVELRDLYWLVKGRHDGHGLYNIPGLDKCITNLGIEFDENGAHSASGDTHATWQLLMRLLSDYAQQEIAGDQQAAETWDKAKAEIVDERRRLARGFVTLYLDGGLYRVAGNSTGPDLKHPKYCAHIEVDDWKRAIVEIELTKWAFHNRTPRDGFYRLSPKEVKQFLSYKNTYDPERADEYRKMYNLRRRRR